MLPNHIRKLQEEIDWLNEHRQWAEWQYFDTWPDWIPENMLDWYDNPGLTMNRLDYIIRRKEREIDRAFRLWQKLATDYGGTSFL
jgi:hypothetical protein